MRAGLGAGGLAGGAAGAGGGPPLPRRPAAAPPPATPPHQPALTPRQPDTQVTCDLWCPTLTLKRPLPTLSLR